FFSTGIFKIGANVGYRGHGESNTTLDLKDGRIKDGSRVTYNVGLALRVLESVDLVGETYGTYLLSSPPADFGALGAGPKDNGIKTSNEVVGGIKVFVERNSYLMIGGGPRYTNGFEAADFRGFLGFIF